MTAERTGRIPYRVQTPRLELRCWDPEDTAVLREALDESANHLRPWIPFMKDEPRSFDQTCQWLREARASFDRDLAWHYAVFDRDDGRLVGGNMLNPRVGQGGLELGRCTEAWLRARSIPGHGALRLRSPRRRAGRDSLRTGEPGQRGHT